LYTVQKHLTNTRKGYFQIPESEDWLDYSRPGPNVMLPKPRFR
jgi:hypothetical protein